MLRKSVAAWAAVAGVLLVATPGPAQHHDHPPDADGVGEVRFPTSCNPEAQALFERGVAMLHSFWFDAADQQFERAAEADPTCAMPHWGLAMTAWGNPMTRLAPAPERTQEGLAAARRAQELAGSATPRERAYIDAALALYEGHETADHLTRMRRHEEALRRLYESAPEDHEAAIFYGRIVVANASPSDLAFERQKYAASILNPLFQERPTHPGLAHYIIHAFDAPPIAHLALDAARRYADIAPAAPHALHMPSHIFTRLGYWDESIETNRRSAAAEPNPRAAVHPLDYLVYAYLQQGRDAEAREVVETTVDEANKYYGGVLGYNLAAMRARYALERGRWAEAAQLEVPSGAVPYAEAVTRFARGMGAARSGNPAAAREESAALAGLKAALEKAGDTYWPVIVEAQRLALDAWIARAEGRNEEALALAARAAEAEESVEKHPVTPGPLLPARELQGQMLLALNQPEAALAAFERNLEREPRRLASLFGAARAAELIGDEARARARYSEVVELLKQADAGRPELTAAREFLARSNS